MIGHVSRKMNQKEMLEMENIVTEMKNAFDGFISRLDRAKERISEFENVSVETSQAEMQRRIKKENIQEW